MYKIDKNGAFYDFGIFCYHDIYSNLEDIYAKIEIPNERPKSITYVFDEEQSVKWNREQVELYNAGLAAARKGAYELRNESLRNLDKAVVNYMVENEASSDTPRAIVELVLRRAQADHDDEWWNYLGRYLDFAEAVLKAAQEV